jgi:hypothetical protein
MEKINQDRGKYVTRSEYQKVCEENKRMKKDIYLLIQPIHSPEAIIRRAYWSDLFGKYALLKSIIKEMFGLPPVGTFCKGCGARIDPANTYCGECLCEDDSDI